MVHSVKLALLGLGIGIGAAAAAAAATDLQPMVGENELDGVVKSQLQFRDGVDTIGRYEPPAGWRYAGSPARLTLTPDWTNTASATITRRPAESAESIPVSPEERLAWAKACAPREAEDVAFVSAPPAEMQIDGIEPKVATYRYTLIGRNIRVTVYLLDREKEQLQFTVTSNDAEHGPVLEKFRRSLFTLNWGLR